MHLVFVYKNFDPFRIPREILRRTRRWAVGDELWANAKTLFYDIYLANQNLGIFFCVCWGFFKTLEGFGGGLWGLRGLPGALLLGPTEALAQDVFHHGSTYPTGITENASQRE